MVHACCNGPPGSRGCVSRSTHQFPTHHKGSLGRQLCKAQTPANPRPQRRKAVALYCDIALVWTAEGTRNELVGIYAIDFFTREVLVNALVRPMVEEDEEWRHKRISSAMMDAATETGKAFASWTEARTELWRVIDADTTVVVYGGGLPLVLLGMIHFSIVDLFILAGTPAYEGTHLTLRGMSQELGAVRHAADGRLPRDEFTDGLPYGVVEALLIREVALWCLENPEDLAQWRGDSDE